MSGLMMPMLIRFAFVNACFGFVVFVLIWHLCLLAVATVKWSNRMFWKNLSCRPPFIIFHLEMSFRISRFMNRTWQTNLLHWRKLCLKCTSGCTPFFDNCRQGCLDLSWCSLQTNEFGFLVTISFLLEFVIHFQYLFRREFVFKCDHDCDFFES